MHDLLILSIGLFVGSTLGAMTLLICQANADREAV